MRIIVPVETLPRERRVALTPEAAGRMVEAGHAVRVERGAGTSAGYPDDAYRGAGAELVDAPAPVEAGDVVVKVRPPRPLEGDAHEADRLPEGAVLVGFLDPLASPGTARRLAARGVTSYAMELVPRISRAQPMDALSSQANAAGYKAALVAADSIGRFFPMLMTAAGTVPPSKVLVVGAGVAGLQAIATARRLGAVVQGYDIRPAVKEQVESLGATYVGFQMEEAEVAGGYAREQTDEEKAEAREHLAGLVSEADAVITTAAVPGKPAPTLITADMVERMRPGSVIVDLAAETGGNCELTRAGETFVHAGVSVVGLDDAASRLATDASRAYARNVTSLLRHLADEEGRVGFDPDDEIAAACCVTHGGEVVHERVKALP